MSLSAEEKYILIDTVIKKYKLKNLVSYLCKLSGVSRSGYYNYFSLKSQTLRKKCNTEDEKI